MRPFSSASFGRACRWALLAVTPALFARASAPDDPEKDLVKLPPFIVEANREGPIWQYAQMPGFEILSRCYEAKSRALARAYFQAHRLHTALLPERFLMRFDVPTKLIFYDENLWPLERQEAVAAMLRALPMLPEKLRNDAGAPSAFDRLRDPDPLFSRALARGGDAADSGRPVQPVAKPISTFFTDMRLTDEDAVIIFALVPEGYNQVFATFLRPTYLAKLLGGRTPTLPPWFVGAFLDLYGRLVIGDDTLTLAPMVLGSAEATTAAQENPESVVRSFRPLLELFATDAQSRMTAGDGGDRVAAMELLLFVRWALDPAGGSRREAFLTFVEQSCTHPATEKTFRDCFGRSSAEVLETVAAYLPHALRHDVTWHAQPIEIPEFSFGPATAGQIARIRGDWERLETAYVRRTSPELEEKYFTKAQRTLQHAYENNERDPRLLAVLGLCELDAGKATEARTYLEAAAEGAVVRPRVYLELARLRLGQELATARDEKLSRAEAMGLLALLSTARNQAPALEGVYGLTAEIWEQCADAPEADDRAVLAEGLRLFPRSAELAYRTAKLYLREGRKAEAATIVETAWQRGAEGSYFERLSALHASLTTATRVP